MKHGDIHRLEGPIDRKKLSRDKWIAYAVIGGFLAVTLGSCAFWLWYPRQAGKVVIAMMPYLQHCETQECEQRVMAAHKVCREQTKVPESPSPNRRTPYDYCMQGELKQ